MWEQLSFKTKERVETIFDEIPRQHNKISEITRGLKENSILNLN